MKVIITSPDAVIDKRSNKLFPHIEEELRAFIAMEKGNYVATVSIHQNDNIPTVFHPLVIKPQYRGSPLLVTEVCAQLKCSPQNIIILGAKRHDMFTAAHSQSLLLRAGYAKVNNPADSIFSNDYGILISEPKQIGKFLKLFYSIIQPWYCKIDVDDKTTLYALTNGNSYRIGGEYKDFYEDFKSCLKLGDGTYLHAFTAFIIVSSYRIMSELKNIDYWGTYPSSDGSLNSELEHIKDKARQSYGGRTNQPIFFRHSPSVKRHEQGTKFREQDWCDSQLKTISLNPYYKDKIAGKNICIIDDFTRYGSSCETARFLLEEAGAAKIVFIALGKFGYDYFKYSYKITGDLFGHFTFKRGSIPPECLTTSYNNGASKEFLTSLKNII
jgi:hypothetical protein